MKNITKIHTLIELDGTANKSQLGANAIVSISLPAPQYGGVPCTENRTEGAEHPGYRCE